MNTTLKNIDRLVVGAGYLGLRAANAWLQAGESVCVTTRSEKKAAQFQKLGLEVVVCDLLDTDSLTQLPYAKTVLHCVALDRQSGQTMKDVSINGLKNLLQAVAKRCEKFFHVSSTSVYGQRAGEIITEKSPCKPLRENGQICLQAENLVRDSGIDSLIFRLAGIYGPDRLIARIKQAQQSIPIPGNPEAWLNLIHVDDGVAALIAAGESNLKNETFLVSDDRPIPRRDYYSLLFKLLKLPQPVFTPEQKDPKGDRGDGKQCDNSKLRQRLLDKLLFPTIEQGLPHAIKSK